MNYLFLFDFRIQDENPSDRDLSDTTELKDGKSVARKHDWCKVVKVKR